MSRLVLGVDGGGTQTRAAIMDETGNLLGAGVGGPTNYDDIGLEATYENLLHTISAAWQDCGLEEQGFAAAFLGLAGVVSEEDHRMIGKIVDRLALGTEARVQVDHDCRIALAGSLSGRPGLVLIAGTGSACYGRTASGRSWRAGGWGGLLADEGSGSWLGLQALRMAVRSFDGREQPSSLVDAVLAHLGISHLDEIMHRIYHVGLSRQQRAALAPVVISAAGAKDELARQLLDDAVGELALSVWAVANHLEMHSGPEVAIVGGLYSVEELFAAPLRAAIRSRLPHSRIRPAELSPVIGACLLALEQIGVDRRAVLPALKASEKALCTRLGRRPSQ